MWKRTIILGDYDTAAHGWTLAPGWALSPAKYRQNFVEVPGMDGPLDLSTVLGGRPVYDTRTLTATLECSEGTRLEREALINDMVNRLTGQRMAIVLPDDPLHHITGRVEVAKNYNDPAHAAVTVTAICGPWREAMEETVEFVPLCGKNLFNNADFEVVYTNSNSIVPSTIATGLRLTNATGAFGCSVFKVLPVAQLIGKTITLSVTMTPSGANIPAVYLGYTSANGKTRHHDKTLLDSGSASLFVEETAGCEYVALWFYANRSSAGTATAADYVDYTNLQLEIGDTATDFEPYHAESPKEVTLTNDQRRTVCPTVIVQGEARLEYDGGSSALSTGVYKLPGLQLGTGEQTVNVSGTGAVAFTYRKAVL